MLHRMHGSEVSTLVQTWTNAAAGTPTSCDYMRIFVNRIEAFVRRNLYDRLPCIGRTSVAPQPLPEPTERA